MRLPKRPNTADDWDVFCDYDSGPITREVFEEEEEPEFTQSAILGPNGNPIIYHNPSEKLGYIGFIPPEMYLEIHEMQAKKRRRKRNASSRKSKA